MRWAILLLVALLCRTARADGHGDRAYSDALALAERLGLQKLKVARGGPSPGQRLVVHVPSDQIPAWCEHFSEGRRYMEPFFAATVGPSGLREPDWSWLRVGGQSWKRYGEGTPYVTATRNGRVAFPYSVDAEELEQAMTAIRCTPNLPYQPHGGIESGTSQNCTDWLTRVIARFTGVGTNSVKGHMAALVEWAPSEPPAWTLSDRMSVMAVMTKDRIVGFGDKTIALPWWR